MIRIILDRLTVDCENTNELESILTVTGKALQDLPLLVKLGNTHVDCDDNET